MFTHPRRESSPRAARRRLPAALVAAAVIASVLACGETTPTETIVELPLFASAAHLGHTGTAGRSFALDMTQELTTTVTGDPDGVGTALLTLNAGLQTVCWSLTASNIALPATASHIHRAAAGLSGPIVVGLTPPGADGSSSGCAEGVDRDLMVDILSDPSLYYVNVHTTEHPPGAIRAQLR
jgi:hypothetical protein